MDKNSKELINEVNAETLKSLGRKLGMSKDLVRKADLVAAFTRYLAHHLTDLVHLLTDRERMTLAEVAYSKQGLDPHVFAAKHGYSCQLPASSYSYGQNRETSLLQVLIYSDEYDRYSDRPPKLHLVKDLVAQIQGMLPRPEGAKIKTVDELPSTYTLSWQGGSETRSLHVYEGEKTVLSELRRVLGLVQSGKIKISEAGKRPTDGSSRIISTSLVVPDFSLEPPKEETDEWTEKAGPIRGHAWGVLVQQCGWAKPKDGILVLTTEGKDILANPSFDRFRNGVQAFLDDNAFDELNRINHIRGQTGKGKQDLIVPSERKRAITKSMIKWPVNSWCTFDEAFRFAIASGHPLTVSMYPYSLYFLELQYGGLESSSDLNRQYMRAFLLESLATLGLVNVAYVYPHGLWPEFSGNWGSDDLSFCGRYDGLVYIRLNSLGAYCLEKTDRYESPVPEKQTLFQILPNHELTVTSAVTLSPADIALLETFAVKISDYVWRIDAEKILNFIESGGTLPEVIRFLEGNSEHGIPENVRTFLMDIETKLNAVVGSQEAILVEINDEHIAAQIAHDSQAGKVCYLAGSNHLAVPKQNLRAFKNALKKMGYLLKP